MQSEPFIQHTIVNSRGSTNPYINWPDVAKYEFPLPPLEEQHRIAEILWAVEDVIEQYKIVFAELTTAQRVKTYNLFLHGVKEATRKTTKIGDIPQHWELKQLHEITTAVHNGFVGTAKRYYVKSANEGVPYLMSNNVRKNRVDLSDLVFISHEFDRKNERTRLNQGDLLTVQSGHVGETCVVPREFDNANCHALIISRPIREIVLSEYLSRYINSSLGDKQLRRIHIGTTIPHINTSDLKNVLIPLPPIKEQQTIVDQCLAFDERIFRVKEHLEILYSTKKQLLESMLNDV